MQLEDITLALFAGSNSARIFAYVPQIHKAAVDTNGASAISRTTWSLFLVAHLSTIAHALVNLGDWWLAACFIANAICCVAILGVASWKKHRHRTNSSNAAPRRAPPLKHRLGAQADEQRELATHVLRSSA
jgi:hypothetical protein